MGGEATRDQVWGYLANYLPDASAPAYPALDRLIDYALAYPRAVVAPTLQRRAPEGAEIDGLRRLDADLAALPATATREEIQKLIYETTGRAASRARWVNVGEFRGVG